MDVYLMKSLNSRQRIGILCDIKLGFGSEQIPRLKIGKLVKYG